MMLSPQKNQGFENPMAGRADTMVFLKQHLPMKQIMTVTRDRFKEIYGILEEAQINKHDQSHQLRTTVNAVQAMQELGFEHEEIMAAAIGGLIHDIGYNQPDHDEKDSDDGYNVGTKATFKQHAKKGAEEAEATLKTMLETVREQGDSNPTLKQLISHRGEDGEMRLIDEEGIEKIAEAILNHNDYGKNKAGYDPRQIGKGALMIQLFDKLDICRERVYSEHMAPETFVEGSGKYDEQYFHKVVPYCISYYEPQMDPETGHMDMTYHVDIDDFKRLMRKRYPHFNYDEDEYVQDFLRAYTKNCRIAAEAAGVILDNTNNSGTLTVKLVFKNGRTHELPFNRPNREIYEEEADGFRASIGDLLKDRAKISQLPMTGKKGRRGGVSIHEVITIN